MDFLMELIMSLILEGSFEAVGSKKLPLILRILLAVALMGIFLAPGILCFFVGFKYQEPVVFFVGVFLAILGILGVWALIKKLKERKNEKIPQRVPSKKEAISEEYYQAVQQLISLAKSKADGATLAKAGKEFFERFQAIHGAADLLLFLSEERREQGEMEGAEALLLLLESEEHCIENKVTLFLRLAEYYLEQGEEARGKIYLKKLCTETVTNFEESIEIHDLGAVWEKYKPLIADQMLPSQNLQEPPSSKRAEQIVFFANELMEEVNSGGFEHYLYYNGLHFEQAEQAMVQLGAEKMQALMARVRNKFLKGKIPKTEEALQTYLDEQEPDFDLEDDFYYDEGEKELIQRLDRFEEENKEQLN